MLSIVSMRPRHSLCCCQILPALTVLVGAVRVDAAVKPAWPLPDVTKSAPATKHDQHPPQRIKLQDIAAGRNTQGMYPTSRK